MPRQLYVLAFLWSIAASETHVSDRDEVPATDCNIKCATKAWYNSAMQPGTQFRFEYKSLAVNTIPGLVDDRSGLKFRMTLVFTSVNDCWQVLEVENVRVYQVKRWAELGNQTYVLDDSLTAIYNEALTHYSVWYRTEAGRLSCLRWHDGEQLWVRNFKRGLLSSFQLDSRHPEIWETGITGTCRVMQTVGVADSAYVVNKVYDTSSCINQPKKITSSVWFNPLRNVVNSQLFSLSRTATVTVERLRLLGGMITSLVADEHHIFRPFGRHHGGPIVHVRQEITLIRDSVKVVSVPVPNNPLVCECSSILFEFDEPNVHIPPSACISDFVTEIKTEIDLLQEKWEQPEQIQYGKRFLGLIRLLRQACLVQLRTVWEDYWILYSKGETQFIEIYLDALSQVGTDQSVKFLTEKILVGSFTVRRTRSIMTDMYFYNITTYRMLRHIRDLAMTNWSSVFPADELQDDAKDLEIESWLLLGSGIQRVENHSEKTKSIEYLLGKLSTLLGELARLHTHLKTAMPPNVAIIKEEIYIIEKDIKALINALGNAVSPQTFNSLWMIASNRALPSDIRYNAIVALKRLVPWRTADILKKMIFLFGDWNTPRQVRIACWDVITETVSNSYPVAWNDIVPLIKGLERDPDLHVGSYVFSWLLDWADHLEIDEQKARFSQFALYSTGAIYWGRKFQQGYLLSKYNVNSWSPISSDEVVVSATVQSVFTDDSTIPHSAAVEVDVHLFGQKIQVFRVEAQATGANWMLEHLFGPAGYFSTNKTWDFRCGLKYVFENLFATEYQDLNFTIQVSFLGKEIRHWARNRQWLEKYMRESSLYNITNAIWWIFHDNGYNMTQECPWTIESPPWHENTGWTMNNVGDFVQRWRDMVGIWRLFYDGTIWERTLNMNMTSLLVETNITIPSIIGLPVYAAIEVAGHVNIATTGKVTLPVELSTQLWPKAVWNHLWGLWKLWKQPRELQWNADINPRLVFDSCASVGIDGYFGGSKVRLQMDVKSNQNFQLTGSLRAQSPQMPDVYTISYTIPKPINTLVSYTSELNMVFWNPSSVSTWALRGDIPVEKGYNCTAKELIGAELCFQYQYYNSSNTWAPWYPFNGNSFGHITLLSLDSKTQPCENCGYEQETCCTYGKGPTHLSAILKKNDWNDFTITVEGIESIPKREIRIDYLRETDNTSLDLVSTNISWNVNQCSHNLRTPQIMTGLQWRWDRVDISGWMTGKGLKWELDSRGWMNRTNFVLNATYWRYEETMDKCIWKLPNKPYKVLMNGSLVNRTGGYFWFEVEDTCSIKHWLNASYWINQHMTAITVNSSFLDKPNWEFGFLLPHPIDTASCHVFGNNFITFDRLHYATKTEGSYILTQDTLNDNVSVVLRHERTQNIRVIDIWIASTKYTLLPKGGLLVDGSKATIPYKSCVVNITIWNPSCDTSYIRFTSRIGLEVYYKPEAIEISINGFYYQRMRGLCGNNNNKIMHEWQRPDNTLATTPEEFVDSWKIVKGPSPTPVQMSGFGSKTYHACDTTFKSKTMEPIGHEVDLRPFYESCLVEVENRSPPMSSWMAVCRAIAGVKVAAFSRDFTYPELTLPLGCLYGDWNGWQQDPKNKHLEFRTRKLVAWCDVCCSKEEREYRNATGLESSFECDPWMFEYISQQHLQKTCITSNVYPTCPDHCLSKFGDGRPTEFKCSSSFETLSVAKPAMLFYKPVVKCICPTPCWMARVRKTSSCQ